MSEKLILKKQVSIINAKPDKKIYLKLPEYSKTIIIKEEYVEELINKLKIITQ